MENNIVVFIVSDSLGETARALTRATISQFENRDLWDIRRFPYINSPELLEEVLNDAKVNDALVLYSLVSEELTKHAETLCQEKEIEYIDLLSNILDKMSKKSGLKPLREAGLIRKMNKSYFDRVEAIEFAVKYDDGKDPRGVLKADLVLVGISRTSKTPLSMYLANKHIKVANVPLVPEVPIPKELANVDPRKIIGLTNSPEKLNSIRSERLKSMGLSSSANYAKLDRILKELDYSEEVMKTLKCPVINVANKAIEETAGIILDILKENGMSIIKDYDI